MSPQPMKRPGRPRIAPDDHSVKVCVTLPARQYDRMYLDAKRNEVSIAEAIRRHLTGRRRI
jgi:hypothetical protein